MALDPAHIDGAVRNVASGIKTLQMARDGAKDDATKQLLSGLMLVSEGLRIALEIMPHRIERLHQKIDRIEKKIGSV